MYAIDAADKSLNAEIAKCKAKPKVPEMFCIDFFIYIPNFTLSPPCSQERNFAPSSSHECVVPISMIIKNIPGGPLSLQSLAPTLIKHAYL